jgi:hypothetical protein
MDTDAFWMRADQSLEDLLKKWVAPSQALTEKSLVFFNDAPTTESKPNGGMLYARCVKVIV